MTNHRDFKDSVASDLGVVFFSLPSVSLYLSSFSLLKYSSLYLSEKYQLLDEVAIQNYFCLGVAVDLHKLHSIFPDRLGYMCFIIVDFM